MRAAECVKQRLAGSRSVEGEKRDGTCVSHAKSRTNMALRLSGDPPSTEEVSHLLGIAPTDQARRGDLIHRGRQQQPVDVWTLDLIERSEWEDGSPLPEVTRRAAEMLRRLTPGLTQLDRNTVNAELWISTIREEAMGGFGIPAEIVAAAGMAQLEISVSVLILLEDDDDRNGENFAQAD
jgi:Domain of unknown function (DUF4279)